MKASEQKQLLPHLQRTVDAIEEVLRSGLTTAGDTTIKTFGVTFQEASRLKLLRLGSTLRNTNQEISRYVADDENFSQKRLAFFLNRSWLLCKGLEIAIRDGNQKQLEHLLWMPPVKKVKKLNVVCLGVVKKVAINNFCAFEFRLREPKKNIAYSWSTVFPLKKGSSVPPEGFLHLPQKQKFNPSLFLEGRVIEITDAMVSQTESPIQRIQLTDSSKVATADEFDRWEKLLTWDIESAMTRIRDHQISPFDVDVELQEEVVFTNYDLGPVEKLADPERKCWPLLDRGCRFDLVVSATTEGKAAARALSTEAKRKDNKSAKEKTGQGKTVKGKNTKARPVLFGVLHYSSGALVVQPLSLFDKEENKLDYITLSKESIDKKALLSALKFT